jgi:hypothetical protein
MPRRRALTAAGLAVALLGLAAAPARAGLADRVGATFLLVADDFIKAVQPIEGLIVAAERNGLYLDLGTAQGAQPGQELTVFRKGDAFRHPLSGKVLGHYETVLGYAQVKRVYANFSEATFIPVPDKPAPQVEDGVRITRGRIKIAITPVLDLTGGHADVRRVPYMLASILERSKRFQVVDPLALSDTFADGRVRIEEILARPERAMRAAQSLEVSGWLVPVLLERRGTIYLDATWISAVTGTPLFSRRHVLLPASATEEPRFQWEPRAED